MSPRTGFRLALLVSLCLALSSTSVAQEQPADEEEPAAEEAEPGAEEAEPGAEEAEPGAEEAEPAAEEAEPAAEQAEQPAPPSSPLSLRALTRRLDGIKATSDRIRGRVDMLKDAVLDGGKGSSTKLVHRNKMGGQFRLTRLVYTVDGTQVFSQRDDGGSLHDKKTIDILSGPIAPGNHTISVTMTYRGHGYGPFKYLNKQTFTVKGSQTFKAVEGKLIAVDVVAFERKNVPLEQRPAVSFKVSKPK